MEVRFSADIVRSRTMTTGELRDTFLLSSLFHPGKSSFVYSDLDRAVVGGIVPGTLPISLPTADPLKAEFFAQRREIGVLNVGTKGAVTVDGTTYDMDHKDCLYIGRGARDIAFRTVASGDPAAFYLVSFPAHVTHPTTLARRADANAVHLGTIEQSNKRTIYQFIHEGGVKSCQLVMGFTELEPGSVWNTMPPHTHTRRMEVYLYFDMQAASRVIHLMGEPKETRHLVVADRQAVLSPGWSIHAGAGTGAYSFCWAMGGENQAFADMDGVPLETLL